MREREGAGLLGGRGRGGGGESMVHLSDKPIMTAWQWASNSRLKIHPELPKMMMRRRRKRREKNKFSDLAFAPRLLSLLNVRCCAIFHHNKRDSHYDVFALRLMYRAPSGVRVPTTISTSALVVVKMAEMRCWRRCDLSDHIAKDGSWRGRGCTVVWQERKKKWDINVECIATTHLDEMHLNVW